MKRRFNKVGVLMGGDSAEREISLLSGKAVENALRASGYNARALVIDKLKDAQSLIKEAKVEAVFVALHGGYGEDGSIQKMLNILKIPYTGSGHKASKLAMDKILSKKEFKKYNLPSPRYKVWHSEVDTDEMSDFGFPLVIKPSSQGSSVGLSVVSEAPAINKAIEAARKHGLEVIAEEYIAGREITVGILDNKPLPVVEILPKSGLYDYKSKYTSGCCSYQVPAKIPVKLSEEVQKIGLLAHKALGCNFFSRVDMRLSVDDKPYILEVNTIPGLTEHSLLPKAAAACGIDFNLLCEKILKAASANKD